MNRTIPRSYSFRMASNIVDDGTLEVVTATVVEPVLGGAAGSKSGRCESASETTLSRSSLYSMEKFYSAKNESHLAIRCKKCGLFKAVYKDA